MTCRDEVLDCAKFIVSQKDENRFTIQEVLKCMQARGTRYKESTIRTHVTSRMCANAPEHHAVKYDDFVRIGEGIYRLKSKANQEVKHMKLAERALQVWQVLICAAHNRQTITYGQLAKVIGMGENPVVVTPSISRVWEHCERNNLPPLTYLVVGKWAGKPGTDFSDLDSERERVFNYSWFRLAPVQVSDFEAQDD